MPKATNEAAATASSIISGGIPILRVPASKEAQPRHPDAIDSHILAYYYAALTNLLCQACLPPMNQEESIGVVQAIIEASYFDVQTLDSWLEACDPNEMLASPNVRLYQEVRETWRQRVMDWARLSKGTTTEHSS